MADFRSDSKLRQMAIKNNTMDKQDKDDVSKLLDINDLTYTMPRNLSVVAARNQKKYTFQRSQYSDTSGSMICTLQTGAQYIDWRNSYLKFGLTVDTSAGGDWHFGLGSACNLFREIIISSRSGVELDRITRLNLLRLHHDRVNMSREELDSVGSLMGYQDYTTSVGTASGYSDNVQARFVIPMRKLSGFFDSPKLCPSHLASGLRIELVLESKATAIRCVAGNTIASYTIADPEVQCDTFLLNDDSTRKLNEISARNGLEYVFQSWHMTSDSKTGDQFNIDTNKAVSRALGAFAVSRLTASITSDVTDSLGSEPTYPVNRTQFRLGSEYYPQHYTERSADQFFNTLYANEKLHSKNPSSLSQAQFSANLWQVDANLERSTVLALTGLPINNSRALSFDIQFSGSASREVNVFLQYVVLARCYINNVSVVE